MRTGDGSGQARKRISLFLRLGLQVQQALPVRRLALQACRHQG
ncbi:MAG: hypothetical protein RLZZ464_2614, partial [Pseudomonadota bacterium]